VPLAVLPGVLEELVLGLELAVAFAEELASPELALTVAPFAPLVPVAPEPLAAVLPGPLVPGAPDPVAPAAPALFVPVADDVVPAAVPAFAPLAPRAAGGGWLA
jgi:hypothetical protein